MNGTNSLKIRILRSPFSNFYNRDIEDSLKTHPDWYLEKIQDYGFNGIWLHCILRDIVKCKQFSEFGKKEKEQINTLNKLIEKAGKYNIKVYLYLCEPRGFKNTDVFWKHNQDVKGQPFIQKNAGLLNGKFYALCSSTNKVKDYLYESSRNLFKKAQGLGGVFMITASEMHTHCYSHFPKWKIEKNYYTQGWVQNKFLCKRCKEKDPSEIVAEIITLVHEGIRSVSKDADVIAWNWSWDIIEPSPQKKLIQLLPEEVILLCDWERGGYKKINGKRLLIDEYSLSYIGPSPKFKKQYKIAKAKNMKVMAKIQIGTTHEMVTVPYIPVPFLLVEKIEKMKKMKLDGYLGAWIFGGEISIMSKIAGLMSKKNISKTIAIKKVAVSEYGENSSFIMDAWKYFSKAWKYYPFSIPFLYYGPMNYAVIYPFSIKKGKKHFIPSWLPLPRNSSGFLSKKPNLETWIKKPFTISFTLKLLNKMLEIWTKGVKILEKIKNKGYINEKSQKELCLAVHIKNSIQSVVNIISFERLLMEKNRNKNKLVKILKEQTRICEQEILIKKTIGFGYHPEAHQDYITEDDLKHAIKEIKKTLKRLNE